MSLDRFYNKLQLIQSRTRDLGQTLSSEDLTSISYDLGIVENIQEDTLNLEAHFYNTQGDYLTSQYDVPYKYSTAYKDFLFDIPFLFDAVNLTSGTYKVSFAFLINLFGNINNTPFFLHEVSADRTELKLRVKLSYANLFPDIVKELQQFRDVAAVLKSTGKLNNVAVNFGGNNIFQVVNIKVECDDTGGINPCQYEGEDGCNELVVYVKLQYPLLPFIQEKEFCFMSFKAIDDYVETFTLKPSEVKPEYNKLRGPKFDSCTTIETSNSTDLKSWNQLLDSDTVTSNSLIRSILSGSEQIPLNIDYTTFDNFVVYGSAVERVKNYNYKRELVEFFDLQSKTATDSNASASFFVSKLTDNYLRRANTVLTEFDDFEKYLHYQTGSIFTYDLTGSISPAPKFVSSGKLINFHTTSSEYVNWYSNLLETANAHDFRNYDSLYYNTPDHILRDSNNSEYVTFLHMVGQHFDNIYAYVKELTSIHRRDEHPQRGIPNKLLPYYARSLGWKIQNTKQLSDLWLYKLGVDQQGQLSTPTGSLVSQAHEQLNHQVWRRVVNNLPALLKTKGTERSIRALFSIYGIPFTLISVKEYGGPKVEDLTVDDTPNLAQDRFHYFLNFDGEQYIEFPRRLTSSSISTYTQIPQTVEFRFKTRYTGSVSMSLWAIEESGNRNNVLHNLELVHFPVSVHGVSTYGYLKYTAATGSQGNLTYKTVTGSLLPYFDNDAWTVRIYSPETIRPAGDFTSTLTIESGKASDFVDSRVSLSSSLTISGTYDDSMLYSLGADNTLNTSGHYLILGGTTGSYSARFSGSLHGYKEYFAYYSKPVFDEHILNPGSYHTDYYSGSYYEMYKYFPLGIDNLKHNHTVYSAVSSSHPNRVISTDTTGTFYNFNGTDTHQYSSAVETYYQYIPSLGANVPKSNKIRIEPSTLTGQLSPSQKMEVSKYDKSKRDSNRLAIVFSPTDQINRDIANQFGPYNFENFIGDPQDGLKDTYPDLIKARDEYFKKFNKANDIGKYIEIFSLYDYTVFTQLKQLVPARANLVTGVLIEPTLLERPKIKRRLPSIDIRDLETNLNTRITDLSSSYAPPYLGVIPPPFEIEADRDKKRGILPINFDLEVERDKRRAVLPVNFEFEIEREKLESETLTKVEVEVERQKHTAVVTRPFILKSSVEDIEAVLNLKDYISNIASEYRGGITGSLKTIKTFKYGSTVTAGLIGGQLIDDTQTYSFISSGQLKTKTIVDRKYEQLAGSYKIADFENTLTIHNQANKVGIFTVRLTSGGPNLTYDPSFLNTDTYTFTFTVYSEDISINYTLVGTKFKDLLQAYSFITYSQDPNIYRQKTKTELTFTYITGSRVTGQVLKLQTYYSSSGEFIQGVTSPLMLTSPVYINSRTGSMKEDYLRERDYAINKEVGAYYSSSYQPSNYQHFEDSNIGNLRFRGSKLSGPGINIDSPNTINGTPAVIVTVVEDNPIRI